MLKTSTLAVAIVLVFPFASYVQAENWYVGGSVLYTDPVDDEVYRNSDGSTTIEYLDGNQVGWKLTGGYQINKSVGVELSYLNTGDPTVRTNIDSGADHVNWSTDSDVWGLDAVYRYPLNPKWSAYGKVGYQWMDYTIKADSWTSGISSASGGDYDVDDFKYGLGLIYALSEQNNLRVGYERFEVDKACDETSCIDVDGDIQYIELTLVHSY